LAVAGKVCTVTGLDGRGLPFSVHLEAGSLFEAAAAGLEQLHNKGCLITQLQITVHEPVKKYKVHPEQLANWLRDYKSEDTVGIRALKSRVRDIMKSNPLKSRLSRQA
jgi:hypothetical protein